eukprot:2859555-Amphidinium_carterae.1
MRTALSRMGKTASASQILACGLDGSTVKDVQQFAEREQFDFLLQRDWKAFDFSEEALLALHEERSHQPLALQWLGGLVLSFSWAFHLMDPLGVTAWVTVYAKDLRATLLHLVEQLSAALWAGASSAMLQYAAVLEPDLHRYGLADRSAKKGEEPQAKFALLFERLLDDVAFS